MGTVGIIVLVGIGIFCLSFGLYSAAISLGYERFVACVIGSCLILGGLIMIGMALFKGEFY